VVGQLSGVCIEDPNIEPPDFDPAEGLSCLSDGDCGDADEICDFSGVTGVGVAFHITGTNAQDTAFIASDSSGQVQQPIPTPTDRAPMPSRHVRIWVTAGQMTVATSSRA